jgi:BMFP domain-containing protein YqiC
MQSENRLFDDMARMAGGALSMLTGVKTEIEAMVRHQVEGWLSGLQLVSREEHETVRQMAAKARDEQEQLALRLAALEARLAAGAKTPVKRPAKSKSKTGPDQTSS